MDVKVLFRGIAVIIDNQINKKDAPIYKIRENLLKNNIPVSCFEDIPEKEMIKSFTNASFIILDWDLHDGDLKIMPGASSLKEENEQAMIDFIRQILQELFIPVFIFSGLNIEEIKHSLEESELFDYEKPNRIFVKSKSEIDSEELLFRSIEEWVKQMPSVYALKIMESNLNEAQNKMFLEWYEYSPQWTTSIWEILRTDGREYQQEFGNFLIRNLENRTQPFEFEESMFQSDKKPDNNALKKVMEYERYINYGDNPPNQAYTGDLFKDEEKNKYYLNVRAQCDLSRKEDDKVSLYLIEGTEKAPQEIVTEDIRLTNEGKLKFPNKEYDLETLIGWCKSVQCTDANSEEAGRQLKKINSKFANYKNLAFYGTGEILEKKNEAYITCVDGGKIIRFSLNLQIKTFSEVKKDRIGRILPPYITRIQQKCSLHMIHEGILPTPKDCFSP